MFGVKSIRALPVVSFALFAAALGCKGGGASTSGGETASAAPAVPYASVQAVMTEKCAGCHGANNPKGGVNLTSYESLMKGGEDGAIVKAGDPAGSELIQVMRHTEGHKPMPPQGPPASEEQIKTVEDWIKAGAKSG
ncbi:c-type cytochrome [bacterium]|nr:MAG: c-type cytochrome [bacterium]